MRNLILRHLIRRSRLAPERLLLDSENESFTYETFLQRMMSLAQYLNKIKIEKGDLIGVHTPWHADYFTALMASWYLGATFEWYDPHQNKNSYKIILNEAELGIQNTLKFSQIGYEEYSENNSYTNMHAFPLFGEEHSFFYESEELEDEVNNLILCLNLHQDNRLIVNRESHCSESLICFCAAVLTGSAVVFRRGNLNLNELNALCVERPVNILLPSQKFINETKFWADAGLHGNCEILLVDQRLPGSELKNLKRKMKTCRIITIATNRGALRQCEGQKNRSSLFQ